MTPERTNPPVELTLHIGTGKTGTTSIQQLLRRNRERLADHGVLFPRSPGAGRHYRILRAVASDKEVRRFEEWRLAGSPDPAKYRARIRRRLVREVREAGLPRVVLTNEALFGAPEDSIKQLRPWLGRFADRVRILVYLRRQDDHLVSRYQQVVKMGEVLRFAEWSQQDLTDTYDYRQRLATWQALQAEQIVVRPFERGRFVEGSLYQDFLDAAGLGVRADALTPIETRNESLGAEAVEFLRLLNLHQVDDLGVKWWNINNRPYVVRLAGAPTGPVLTLPQDDLNRFMDRWAESNRAVARDFLGDPAGKLFHSGRKTDDTTTEQRLDPARLDHYFELLDIPEELQAAVRVLAEREAGRPGR